MIRVALVILILCWAIVTSAGLKGCITPTSGPIDPKRVQTP